MLCRNHLSTPGVESDDCIGKEHSARTRVHEYGGGAFALLDRPGFKEEPLVAFSNDDDHRLYLKQGSSSPLPLTPRNDSLRFADFQFDPAGRRIVSVVERNTGDLPENFLCEVSLPDGGLSVLASGADFYSNPRFAPDGTRLLWLEWNLPSMPWDSTRLCAATIPAKGGLGPVQCVAGGPGVSVFQPDWLADGSIVFVSDESGWWNLQRIAPNSDHAVPLIPMNAEFGRPQWVFAMSTWAELSRGQLFCAYNVGGAWNAGLLTENGTFVPHNLPFCEISALTAHGNTVGLVAASSTEASGLFAYDMETRKLRLIRSSTDAQIEPDDVSVPESLQFPCSDGQLGQAYFYPPKSARFEPLPNERPPVILRAHGGPTAATSAAFRLEIQYWTTRGFAVLDVNYRGSSGFGRPYRLSLQGRWGVADVADCLAALRSVSGAGRVDAERTAFSGGSAGGLTVLSALAFHEGIRAAAVYYGVADLAALAKDTHKFELRYLDQLVGPYPEAADLYRDRSPLFAADRIRTPVILFQGLEDRVVPPQQTRAIEEALRANGVHIEALYFEGEGHGFRSATAIESCLESELAFYRNVFRIVQV